MPDIVAPLTATVSACLVAPGDPVRRGQPLLRLEAMKMEHEVTAPADGRIGELFVADGELVQAGDALLRWRAEAPTGEAPDQSTTALAEPHERPDLRAWRDRLELLDDAARPEAVARRHAAGGLTARETLAALCDPGSLLEYGALAVAAQTARRPIDELRATTPADGVLTVRAMLHGAPVAVMAYDATVLAGTQGFRGHQKSDRLMELAERERLPFVLFAEGGGGRPGDTDMPVVAGLHVPTFARMAALANTVPTLGVAAGRCFAGNAALLACCDLVLATRGANLGLGGPAMVEGGGLGRFEPEQIGPATELAGVGAVDLLVTDEREAAVRAPAR